MTVESANYISQLNKSYPRNRDLIKEGDDHIRLTKGVLQNTFPGMDKPLTATSDKLNKLDTTFEYEGDDITIKSNLTLAEKKTVDFGGAVLEGVGDPKEGTDAVNLQSLQGTLMWPVGSIFLTVDSRNPSEILGFGNWEKFAAGRLICGTGTTTDTNNETFTVVNEQRGGAMKSAMTADNIPKHTHVVTGTAAEGGTHTHSFPAGGGSDGPREALAIDENEDTGNHDWRGVREGGKPAVNNGGAHTHALTVTVEEAGKGEAFSILPPFMACNIWLRKPDT